VPASAAILHPRHDPAAPFLFVFIGSPFHRPKYRPAQPGKVYTLPARLAPRTGESQRRSLPSSVTKHSRASTRPTNVQLPLPQSSRQLGGNVPKHAGSIALFSLSATIGHAGRLARRLARIIAASLAPGSLRKGTRARCLGCHNPRRENPRNSDSSAPGLFRRNTRHKAQSRNDPRRNWWRADRCPRCNSAE
jgi:hypothetical protein